MKFISVDILWEKNKSTSWEINSTYPYEGLGEFLGTITLEEVLGEKFDNFFDEDLQPHVDSVFYWCEMFVKYIGMEDGIPENYAIEVEDDKIEDGNHRLVAAKMVGLTKLPIQEK